MGFYLMTITSSLSASCGIQSIKVDLHETKYFCLDLLSPIWPYELLCKTYLDHTLTKARNICDAFQVLSIRIAINLKICLKNMDLLISECCSVPFWFSVLVSIVFRITLTSIAVGRRTIASLYQLQVVTFAKHLVKEMFMFFLVQYLRMCHVEYLVTN